MGALLQSLIVAAVVALAATYSAWTLMPASWRRDLAAWLLRRPGLRGSATLQAAARQAPGCGACGDCGGVVPPGAARPIRLLRRRP